MVFGQPADASCPYPYPRSFASSSGDRRRGRARGSREGLLTYECDMHTFYKGAPDAVVLPESRRAGG